MAWFGVEGEIHELNRREAGGREGGREEGPKAAFVF